MQEAIRAHFARPSERLRRDLRDLLRRGWKWPISRRRLYDRLSRVSVRIVYRTSPAGRGDGPTAKNGIDIFS